MDSINKRVVIFLFLCLLTFVLHKVFLFCGLSISPFPYPDFVLLNMLIAFGMPNA